MTDKKFPPPGKTFDDDLRQTIEYSDQALPKPDHLGASHEPTGRRMPSDLSDSRAQHQSKSEGRG